jgi:hypothetical protein
MNAKDNPKKSSCVEPAGQLAEINSRAHHVSRFEIAGILCSAVSIYGPLIALIPHDFTRPIAIVLASCCAPGIMLGCIARSRGHKNWVSFFSILLGALGALQMLKILQMLHALHISN